jgi:DNA-binding MarR family transcriptional regulator
MSKMKLPEGSKAIITDKDGNQIYDGKAASLELSGPPRSEPGFMKVYTARLKPFLKELRKHGTTQTILTWMMDEVDTGESEALINQSEIARDLEIPLPAVNRSLKQLSEMGLIKKTGNVGNLNKYMLNQDIFVKTYESERRKASRIWDELSRPKTKIEEHINQLNSYIEHCETNLKSAKERLLVMKNEIKETTNY